MLSKRWLFLLLGPVPHYPPFLGSLLHAHKKKSLFFLVFGSLTSVASVPVTEAGASVTLTEARTEGTTEVQLYRRRFDSSLVLRVVKRETNTAS
jgi:hypothetical protein